VSCSVDASSVVQKRRESSIESRRSKTHDAIPAHLSKQLYEKSLELSATGLGSIRIARELSRASSLSISPGTIAHWIAGNRRPRLRNIFEEKPSPNLSYVIGAAKGDGCSLSKSSLVKLEVTDWDFATTFNSAMAQLFSRDTPNKILTRRFGSTRKTLYIVKYSSRQLVELLRRPVMTLSNLVVVHPRDFLRGFFDAEGHADVTATTRLTLAVGADNCDRSILLLVKRTLADALWIQAIVQLRRKAGFRKVIRTDSFVTKRTSYAVRITRLHAVEKFSSGIGFSICRKKEKLDDALRIYRLHGPTLGAVLWRESYFKRNGQWRKRAEVPAQ
jgi:intein-encoded DNA endonuclease-like protein